MATESTIDETWSGLADLEPEAREAQMASRYQALAQVDQEARFTQMLPMVTSEYTLAEDKLRAFTLSRMRTLLSLPEESALTVMESYDRVMRQMPATAAMRRVSLVQSLAIEFSSEDEERLRKIAPAVFAGAPRRMPLASELPPSLAIDTHAPKKPWWQFWK